MSHLHEIKYFFQGYKPVRISVGRFEFPEDFTVLHSDEPETQGKMVLHVRIVNGASQMRCHSVALEPANA